MMHMASWAPDIGLAVLLSGLEVAALVLFCFLEGLKQWATKGWAVPGRTRRSILALGLGAASSALIGFGLSGADLPVARASQSVMALLLALLLILVAGHEGYDRFCTYRFRSRRARPGCRGPVGGAPHRSAPDPHHLVGRGSAPDTRHDSRCKRCQ
ncbi:DUF6234 family protein [Streptomyces sp. Ncost-T6T-1]|uniref:DUF6234 family protein n=1 Tax=Streptomyces sp. Ncost-T6T-1 TaxID=1100828 RepID=UPI00406D1053